MKYKVHEDWKGYVEIPKALEGRVVEILDGAGSFGYPVSYIKARLDGRFEPHRQLITWTCKASDRIEEREKRGKHRKMWRLKTRGGSQ